MKTKIMLECKQCGKWWRTTNQYRTIPIGCNHVKVVHVCQTCKKVYDSDEREEAENCCESEPIQIQAVIKPSDITPLNGRKTHPLTKHGLYALNQIATAPAPGNEFNPGIINRLTRGGLAEIVQLASPYKRHKGRSISFLQITEAGKLILKESE